MQSIELWDSQSIRDHSNSRGVLCGSIGHFPHGGILVVDPFKEVIIKVNRSTTTVGIGLG